MMQDKQTRFTFLRIVPKQKFNYVAVYKKTDTVQVVLKLTEAQLFYENYFVFVFGQSSAEHYKC